MLRTIGRFGITLSLASTLGVASLGTHPVLAREKAIASDRPHNHLSTVTAQVPKDSAPTRPQNSSNSRPTAELRCISGCVPEYPAALAGKEGRVRLRLVIDRNGNVVEAKVIEGNASNAAPKDEETSIHSQFAEAALTAARQMKFAPLANKEQVVVRVTFNFTIPHTDFDRQVRQRRTQNEREVQLKETNLAPLK